MVIRYYKFLGLITVLLVLCVMMPFLLLYSYEIPGDDTNTVIPDTNTVTLRKALDLEVDKSMNSRYDDLKLQIDELERIKVSVRNEMRELEKKRNDIIHETETQKTSYYKLQSDIHQGQKKLTVLQEELVKVGHKLYAATPPPNIHQSDPPPIFIIADPQRNSPHLSNTKSRDRPLLYKNSGISDCENDISNCIDLTKCPLTSNLKFYVYPPESYLPSTIRIKYPDLLKNFINHLKDTNSLADTPNEACLLIVFLGPIDDESSGPIEFEDIVYNLPHWKRNGKNHVIVNLLDVEGKNTVLLEEFDPLKAIFVQNHIHTYYRPHYDLLTPLVGSVFTSISLWRQLPPILPASRKFLLYFSGESVDEDDFIGHVLKKILQHVKDPVHIELKCPEGARDTNRDSKKREISMCGSMKDRWNILKQSTFSLVPDTTYTGLIRLNEALKSGAIPVIIGSSPLPFGSVIDWNKAAILIPAVRLREIHYIIRSIPENRIVELRRQGRFIWETYFSSLLKVLINMAAILRYQLSHAPPPVEGVEGKLRIYGPKYQLVSPTFQYNSSVYNHQYWNSPPGPLSMFPSTPWDPPPISGSAYASMNDSQLKSLPPHILQAGGITGPFFENYLLGDKPVEYFTIVILTYKREEVVIESVEKLDKLKFLAKVIVVWNDLDKSPYDLNWPEISAPVEVSNCSTIVIHLLSNSSLLSLSGHLG